MSIQYHCANCGNTIQTPDDSAGKQGRCPHCAHVMQIPGPSGPAAAAAPLPSAAPRQQVGNPFADPSQSSPQFVAPQPAQQAAPYPAAPHQHAQPYNAAPQAGYQPAGYAGPGYDGQIYSHRSKIAAGLLGIFVGGWGVHRFYLGFVGIGLLQIFVSIITCGIGGLWGFVEGILYLTGSLDRDVDGRLLRD